MRGWAGTARAGGSHRRRRNREGRWRAQCWRHSWRHTALGEMLGPGTVLTPAETLLEVMASHTV